MRRILARRKFVCGARRNSFDFVHTGGKFSGVVFKNESAVAPVEPQWHRGVTSLCLNAFGPQAGVLPVFRRTCCVGHLCGFVVCFPHHFPICLVIVTCLKGTRLISWHDSRMVALICEFRFEIVLEYVCHFVCIRVRSGR